MATISVLNTSSDLSGKTLVTAEGDRTLTGLLTFDRDPSAPFVVTSGSAKVTNLSADLLDDLDSTVFARWDGGGTPLGQIAFPAAQSASSGANVLDDYEEGTWVPVLGGSGGTSGQTYTTQLGWYVKTGKLVSAYFNIVLSAKGTITTSVQIQGLPFTIENLTSHPAILNISYWTALGTAFVFVGGFGNPNSTFATVYGAAAAATGLTALATADISNTTQLMGLITFRATA